MPAADAAEKAASGAGSALWRCCKGIFRCFLAAFNMLTACIKKLPIAVVSLMLRVLNIANAVLLAAACVFIFMKASNAGVNLTVTQTFLTVYIGVFAVLLFAFESRIKWTEGPIRRNFGFMFTYMGRAVFLIFLSAVCFGMLNSNQTDTPWYSWAAGAGAGTLINSVLNCIVICSHPGFAEMSKQAEEEATRAPAGADPTRMTDGQIAAYLAANPEIARKALAGVSASPVPGQAAEGAAAPFGGEAGAAGVAEWGAASSKPAAGNGAAVPAAAASTGFFGFGGGKKDKAGKGVGSPPAGAAAAAGGGGYVPPSVAPAHVAVSTSVSPGQDASGGSNPFSIGSPGALSPSGGVATAAAPQQPATAAVPRASVASPPAPAAYAPPAPAAKPAGGDDFEDNPFAS